MRIVGMMPVYNEADIVGQVIEHLASQEIMLVVMDNGSTDGSFEIIKHYVGKGVLSAERMVTEKFEFLLMLRRLYAMAIEQDPDWVLLNGADEFLEAPYRGFTLDRAILIEAERGYNLIQFNEFEFFPTEKDLDSRERDVRRRLRYYSWQDDYQFRCWKVYAGMNVDELAGHEPSFPPGVEVRFSPNKFVIRHYKIRSYEHGLRKIFRDRLPRYAPELRAKGWHIHYDNFGTQRDYFVIDSSKLTRYDEDGNWNLARTFDGSFGSWNPPSNIRPSVISKLENDIDGLQQEVRKRDHDINRLRQELDGLQQEVRKRDLIITELENSLSLRLARRIPFGTRIRKLLVPKK